VQNRHEAALGELRTTALPSTCALALLIFGIAGLSAFSLFVIAGLAALCALLTTLLPFRGIPRSET
jgi:hypothetical protein